MSLPVADVPALDCMGRFLSGWEFDAVIQTIEKLIQPGSAIDRLASRVKAFPNRARDTREQCGLYYVDLYHASFDKR